MRHTPSESLSLSLRNVGLAKLLPPPISVRATNEPNYRDVRRPPVMLRRDSDLLALVRPPRASRLSYSYSQCSSRSRSGSFESESVRWSERASSIAPSDCDGSELLDVDDLQLLQQQQQQQHADGRETVRVTVRFRPLVPKEKSSSRSAWTVHTETGTVEAAPVLGQNARRRGVYAFDEVYDAQHSTGAIYDGLARSIARSALDGIHGSIFAYGQTSSGKTYTMQGTGVRRRRTLVQEEKKVETEEDRRPEDSDGLVQLAVKDLFDEMARRSDVEYLVRVSYLEVYNETVKDLLVSGGSTATGKRRDPSVHIREHPVTGVFTDNSERVVTDARGVLQALRDGEKQRAVGVTRMNERSSRSHSIFRVVIESKTRLESPVPTEDDAGAERVRVGCLNFVDLAGSESARAVSSGGKRLTTESGNINRSLLALSRVVVALGSSKSNQHDHINFRDSKLTRILQPSLSGAARVLFVCCASPAPIYIEDTRSTLKFASRAKRIKVNAGVNEVVDQRARALMELAHENQVLRQQLEALASASRDEMDAMEEHAARLRMRVVSLEAAAAAPGWASSVVIAPASDANQKSRDPEVTGLEGANSPTDSDNQVLDMDLSDEEDTDVDSQFDSPTGSPLLEADAACPTCETLDDALEIAKTRELESYLRIEELEEQVVQLQRHHESESTSTAIETEEESAEESHCVLDVEDDEADETKALSGSEEGVVSSIAHASSLSLASAALLTVVVDALKKRSPTEALAIVICPKSTFHTNVELSALSSARETWKTEPSRTFPGTSWADGLHVLGPVVYRFANGIFQLEEKPKPPVTSVLHPDTPEQAPLNPLIAFSVKTSRQFFHEYEESFPQHGKSEAGQHYRIENTHLLTKPDSREGGSVLILCVFNDAKSWGNNRKMADFFELIGSFHYPTAKISVTLLTSSATEFTKAKAFFSTYIQRYPRLSVIFRSDFAPGGLTRANRHDHSLQASRRRMLARYRNYALLSTMASWHQHVVWLDADISFVPAGLLQKMVQSGRDILEPMCVRRIKAKWHNYDANAWVGQRKVRSADQSGADFVPGPLNARSFHNLPDRSKPFVPLDSVGGTMLYVRADIHRQGIVFPSHYVIGSEWGREGYDGIETEGLCSAHFLGFKCWGMPKDAIEHA
ncbi:hypothetical protein PHYPSEUDO_011399 [Phytophthora pseudosyringae]|uniref:Kinesin motor domain-containing protein n=1 Tax=Phytophthora pseudosyringae TaxID=221518 RepID=A0A8T1VDM4_9STRA|nr:hypothetical protein PHYPSEUDO_011399 [Phytophthora pseudosyringae]